MGCALPIPPMQASRSAEPAEAATDATAIAAAPPATVHPYLSAEQVCELTPWTPDALEKLMRRGVLKRGVHYFQPFGHRSRLFFKWEAIVALIEGRPVPSETAPVVDEPRPPKLQAVPKRRRTIDVEKATTNLQRMLG